MSNSQHGISKGEVGEAADVTASLAGVEIDAVVETTTTSEHDSERGWDGSKHTYGDDEAACEECKKLACPSGGPMSNSQHGISNDEVGEVER